MRAPVWRPSDLPGDLTGRRVLVTGATSGLGRTTARELAARGAHVVLGGRSPSRLARTEAELRGVVRGARFERVVVDLADLASVRRAADKIAGLGGLDTLVNNGGVMALPFTRTVDGFEIQLGTNHFGPFLLTGLLLPLLGASGDGRVVTVASQASQWGRLRLDDPRDEREPGTRIQRYGDSKLANLVFGLELDRRLRAVGLPVRSLVVHPGWANSRLLSKMSPGWRGDLLQAAVGWSGQPSLLGAMPTLVAATIDLPGGTYIGPRALAEMRGLPTVVEPAARARDLDAAARLWELSERAVDLSYPRRP